MSSSKPFSVLACLLCLALPALAEKKPTDNRSSSSDGRSSGYTQEFRPKVDTVGGKHLDQWVRDLTHADPSRVADAVVAIVQFGEEAGQYVPDLLKILHHRDASPRMKAILALRMIRIPDTQRSPVFKALGRCLMDPYSEGVHRYEAVNTLMYLMRFRFGPPVGDERGIIMDLVQNTSSHNSELRELCIDAIITAGPDPKRGPDPRVTDAMILRATPLREPAEKVRYKAIMALGALGRPQNPDNLKKVIYILKNPGNYSSRNRIIRMWTHVSLMALDETIPKKELDAILKLLEDPEAHIKIQAITALGALRGKAKDYVGKICDSVKREKDPMVLLIAAQALGGMELKGERIIKTLIRITELDEVRYAGAVLSACNALKELGGKDADTLKALEKVLDHKSMDTPQKALVEMFIKNIKNPPPKPLKGVH